MIIKKISSSFKPSEFSCADLLGWKKLSYVTERELVLVESGDYIPELQDVTHEFYNQPDLKNFKVFQSERGDFAITHEKDGAGEIHHASADGKSGSILTHEHNTKEPNVKFVSMLVHLGKKFVADGKVVRISAPENMAPKYHRIVSRMKGADNFTVSDLSFHKHDKDAHGNTVAYHQFYVTLKRAV